MPKKLFVVVFGNPFEGLEVYGTFKTTSEAHSWAEEVERQTEPDPWWVVPVINKRI